ncbi:phage portal protein [Hyphococcus sp. DH-69]|uniref:phage portal protein n=1 Tax=Hyphococcus formosus TaxID=3143534 RepID=UPI00398AE5BA
MSIIQKLFSRAPEAKASAAKALIAMHRLGAPAWTPRDYASLARSGFERNVIAYRCVRLTAEAAASAPLTVKEGGEVLSDHPLIDLLARPNDEQSGSELLESFYGYLQTAGNAYLEAVSLDGTPRELYSLRPDRMKARTGQSGWAEAYEYSAGGRSVVFRKPEIGQAPILHLKLFHPTNDHYGLSPLEAAATAVDLHNAASAWNKSLLDNAARPSGALVYNGPEGAENLTAEQFDRLKSELEDAYQGSANAGRPLVLDGGLEWRSMSLSPSDMDFIEAKNAAAREIALAFGVPPMLLGIPGDNTYSNYREANLAFWKQTVLPLVKKTAAALSNWFAPVYPGVSVICQSTDIDALSADRDALWARVSRADFLSDDEKRQALGLEVRNA